MNKDPITSTTAETFSAINSIFKSNSGILITHDSSTLTVISCFFDQCSKEIGGSIRFESVSGRSDINKTCSYKSSLTSTEKYGIFCYIKGSSRLSLVSCIDVMSETNRDVLCHDFVKQHMKSINLSHISCRQSAFAYTNPGSEEELIFEYCIAFNITSQHDIIKIASGLLACFKAFNIISCISKEAGHNLFLT